MNLKTNLLTPQEVSEMLGVSTITLSMWRTAKRYNLPYVKAGRLVRYRLSDVEKFISARIVGGTNDE